MVTAVGIRVRGKLALDCLPLGLIKRTLRCQCWKETAISRWIWRCFSKHFLIVNKGLRDSSFARKNNITEIWGRLASNFNICTKSWLPSTLPIYHGWKGRVPFLLAEFSLEKKNNLDNHQTSTSLIFRITCFMRYAMFVMSTVTIL
jgi:hypothetical protein